MSVISEFRENLQKPRRTRPRAPRLSTLAGLIETLFGYQTKIETSFCNTDTKYKGTRLRRPGVGREGKRLIVMKGTEFVFSHDSAQTYRENYDVIRWIVRHAESKKIK